MSAGSRRASLVRTRSLIRRMISPARRAWPAICFSASRTSASSGSGAASSRSLATAKLVMAVSGWLISWAMAPAISPSVARWETRLMRCCIRCRSSVA